MSKIFVAGHKGLVGSALIRSAPLNFELIVASRQEVNLSSEESTFNYFQRHQPETVILAAAKVGGILENSQNQKDFLVKNLEIQNAVMLAALRADVSNFIFLGSSCVYPRDVHQPILEDSLMTGKLETTNEGYALAKIAGIRLCRAIFEEEKRNYFSVMPTNLYGPNDNFDLTSSHVPAALMRKFHEAKLSNSNTVEVWGSGRPRREFMHVDDLASACWFLLGQNRGGELINVGTGIDIEISKFASLMGKIMDFQGEITFNLSKPDGTPRKLLDVSKIHSYGWQHQIELEDGLRQTYAWFVDALKKGEVRGY
jgi:GDP-L-fucose synthase